MENATFGDLIVLPHIEETEDIANSVKSVEMLKFLSAQSQRWRFVTKIDDDSYFDADRFYKAYLEPLLEGRVATTRTIIARTLAFDGFTYTYPGGQFYTMTWDLVPLLASLHEKDPIPDEYEDVLVGRLLFEAGESWTHTDLNNHLAFDYDGNFTRGDGTAWASNVTQLDEWSHAVGPGAINPHKMKEDETYLQVAACYDENGLKMDEWKARL